ncbi:site-specific DNA-methyltransferase [Clostridium disporicum]|uniref:site-specific DNA-methyltransferase n=1 Tax=Clostridium disporicum TaxID=84024 RepID=UPI00360E2E25
MEKISGASMDIVADNISKLKELFPEVFCEDKIDFERLQEVLGNYIEDKEERYRFEWNGKSKAIRIAQTSSTGTLRPCKEESKNWDTTQNLYIEGDNLEVLKLLQKNYQGKVKLIYIDPPYNTGKDFVYPDNYIDNIKNYLAVTGQFDEENNKITTNVETSGRFHTDWLNMMYPRLRLARNLLSDEGAIFISIDEKEVSNLKKICDELFGEQNFVNIITCKTKVAGVSGSNLGKSLQDNTEYCLVYSRNIDNFSIIKAPVKKQEIIEYIKAMEVLNKSWKYTSVITDLDDGEFVKSIKDGNGDEIKVYKHKKYNISSINKIAKEEFNGEINKVYYKYINNIFRTTNAQSSIRARVMDECSEIEEDIISIEYIPQKGKNTGKITKLFYKDKARNLITWLSDVIKEEDEKIYKLDNKGNLWDDLQYNNLTKEGNIKFPNGKKPLQMINDIVNMVVESGDIVLDFFSGSATTAHSVMALNAEDSGCRKFIMVQFPEIIQPNDKDRKEYIQYLKEEGIKPIISEVGKERIRRAGEQIVKEVNNAKVDIGFKVFKLDSSNIKKWNPDYDNLEQSFDDILENFVLDRTEEDVVYEIMLKYGIDLTYPVEERVINGKEVFSVGFGALIICLDDNITLDVVNGIVELKEELEPEICRVVFKDNGFANDSVKTNAVQILKRNNIKEIMSI